MKFQGESTSQKFMTKKTMIWCVFLSLSSWHNHLTLQSWPFAPYQEGQQIKVKVVAYKDAGFIGAVLKKALAAECVLTPRYFALFGLVLNQTLLSVF